MKILLVNKYFYLKGGSEVSFFETGKLLANKGHKVMYFSMEHPRNFPSKYGTYFVSNVDYEKGGFKNKIDSSLKILYSFEARRKIEELIKKEKPDIVHLHNIHHQISPSILHSFKRYSIPIIFTIHDYKMVCASYSMLANGNVCEACRDGMYYQCFLKGCIKGSRIKSIVGTVEMYLHHNIFQIYDLIDVFISPSKFLKSKLEEMGFKGKLVNLPYHLILDDFKPQYNWQDIYILYFGRLSKEKGLFTLIEAVKGLNIPLKVLGEGPIKDDLSRKLQVEGCRNIELSGYLSGEELKSEIRKSMFVVVPSEWYENYPFSIIEAFALGKPVIGSRIGGIPELVKDYETGLTFEAGNSIDLCEKIKILLSDDALRIKMGQNARELVETKLNPEKHYKNLMKIYQSVIEKSD